MKEVNKSSQIFNLIQQIVNESPIDSLQRDMKHLRDLRDSVSAFP